MDNTGNTSSTPTYNTSIVYRRKFQIALGLIVPIGAVVWASQTGRKGKFWWWVGGTLAGQAVGFVLDGLSKANKA